MIRDPGEEVGEPGLPITLFILAVMIRLINRGTLSASVKSLT